MLTALRPELPAGEARVLAHAAFGLMNSTPFLGGEVDRRRRAELLRGRDPGRAAGGLTGRLRSTERDAGRCTSSQPWTIVPTSRTPGGRT